MRNASWTPLAQPSFLPWHRECAAMRSAGESPGAAAVPRDFLDSPSVAGWAHRDVSGAYRRVPSPMQLARALAKHTRLSDLFISLQVSPYLLHPAPSCGSKHVLYDPTQCLLDHQWAGYAFHVNPLPPFNLTVVYSGRALGPGVKMPSTDVHSIHLPARDAQWSSVVSTYKSMNHHSPDLLFMSPFVGNCQILDRLLSSGAVKPKIVYMPINPLLAPPAEATPNFFDWWRDNGDDFVLQLAGVPPPPDGSEPVLPITTSLWTAQCSLASASGMMSRQGYELMHVEHTFAVFLWRPLFKQLAAEHPEKPGAPDAALSFGLRSDGARAAAAEAAADGDAGRSEVPSETSSAPSASPASGSVSGAERLYAAWMRGWKCSPHARYLFNLENLVESTDGAPAPDAGPEPSLRELAARVEEEVPTLRYFLGRRSERGRSTRGHCAGGICECLPPYRGRLCERVDPPRVPQKISAVIHYITAETERDLVDLTRSLSTLWARFNQRHDYPVVIFHEGLSPAARKRLVLASENRIWLVLLPGFKAVPPEWQASSQEVAQEFAVGYRAMIRWRSGPLFLEPALADFDYAMTLDTDSYFPADFTADPFAVLEARGLVAAFPHLGRESASVVVNFMHHFLLYCRLRGLHPRRTRVLASLIEVNFKWYQQCLMLDMEVVRLDWFRGEEYQDMFRYMDAAGGFWLHRWGNNPFRTFAVGLLLEDSNVSSLTLPYAHQDFCSCGAGAAPCRWRPELSAYDCPDADASVAGRQRPSGSVAVGDLADGLLQLQPWRGTEWQKEAFDAEEIRNFVSEQITF
eukprot:TRINITY_DN16991_c0_g1_i2.p1 TRINITY_DN16991_c0_g1~~TRINITY_DN16991_c0_g1_i2.p1  ORF type:complete len:803 (-),score=145.33 TRINITY_DN16991_c0_g1_i2:30-2438(-)